MHNEDLQACYDLIAVILGDGGHRREEIGTCAAAKEAREKYETMRADLAEAQFERQELQKKRDPNQNK